MLSLTDIKKLYGQGMDYAKQKYKSILYSQDNAICDYQLSLVNQAQDLTTLMNAIWIGNVNSLWTTAFKAPKPICTGCELSYTGIQFGIAHVGWYFLYGIAGNLCFNLSFFRLEIAPKQVVEQAGIQPYQAVAWSVLGGYGTIVPQGSEWYSIQSEWIQMAYEQPTYSTFTLAGQGKNIQTTLYSLAPMTFQINTTYTDTNNKPHTLQINMNANTPPTANVPTTCECAFGLGSFYYSYTDMSVSIIADGNTQTGGSGWVDHQLIKNGIANTIYGQALQTVGSMYQKTVSPGWLWTTIQDHQTGKQYMFTHFFGKKFYISDVSISEELVNGMINVYEKGVPHFNPPSSSDLKMVMTRTIKSPSGINLPASYNITLPGGKQVVLSIATAPNVYPTSFAPYETPAFLYDMNNNIIGTGLIEANFYFDNNTLAQRLIQFAGGSVNDVPIVLNAMTKPQNWFQKLLAILIVFSPLLAIIFAVWFVLAEKDKGRRKYKIGLSVAILLLLYGMFKIYSGTD